MNIHNEPTLAQNDPSPKREDSRFPFTGARLASLVVVFFIVTVFYEWQPDDITGRSNQRLFCILSVAVMACLWEAHLSLRNGWVGSFGWRLAENAGYFLIGSILFAFLLSPLYPAIGEYTIRARVSELILAGSSAKGDVAEAIGGGATMEEASRRAIVKREGSVSYARVLPNGTILVASTKLGAIVVMTPTVIDLGDNHPKLTWSCAGAPQKYMPMSCRDANVR
jgi:type IV pilus assembly protein PilA